jgi:hypothetical protein
MDRDVPSSLCAQRWSPPLAAQTASRIQPFCVRWRLRSEVFRLTTRELTNAFRSLPTSRSPRECGLPRLGRHPSMILHRALHCAVPPTHTELLDVAGGLAFSRRACGQCGASGLQPLHKVHDPAAQGIGQDLQRLESDVALATLDLADVRAMQTRTVGEHVLRPPIFVPQCANLGPELSLYPLHQEKFGAMLVLAILVITSSRCAAKTLFLW